MELLIDQLKQLEEVHYRCQKYLPYVKRNAIVSIYLCGFSVLVTIALLIRSLFNVEKRFFVVILTCMLVGMIGTCASVCLLWKIYEVVAQQTFEEFLKDLSQTWPKIHAMLQGLCWTVAVGQFTFDLAHWLFVVKYWNLSIKIQAQVNRTDERTTLSRVVYYTFIAVLVVLASTFLGLSVYEVNHLNTTTPSNITRNLWLSNIFALAPCFTSFGFLIDAMKRMSSLSNELVVISKMKVIIHSATFALICLCGTLVVVVFTVKNSSYRFTYESELVVLIALVVSNLPLLSILFTIMVQSKKHEIMTVMVYADAYERSTFTESELHRGSYHASTSDIQSQDSGLRKSITRSSQHASAQISELEQNIMDNMFNKH